MGMIEDLELQSENGERSTLKARRGTGKGILYLVGPMRGIPKHNFPAFYAAEADLLELGFDVINPARLDEAEGFDPEGAASAEMILEFLRRDIDLLFDVVDGIVMLPGWESSAGANLQFWLARALNKRILILC
jgi:Domain of unknown function (DUF4406)